MDKMGSSGKHISRILSASELATEEEFLEICNGNCRTRTANKGDYEIYKQAFEEAGQRKKNNLPFYEERNAGGVARAYFKRGLFRATTAFWGVWIEPSTKEVVSHFGRAVIYGRQVCCARQNGVRTYIKEWRKENPATIIPKLIGL
jgi:hypothetical protein